MLGNSLLQSCPVHREMLSTAPGPCLQDTSCITPSHSDPKYPHCQNTPLSQISCGELQTYRKIPLTSGRAIAEHCACRMVCVYAGDQTLNSVNTQQMLSHGATPSPKYCCSFKGWPWSTTNHCLLPLSLVAVKENHLKKSHHHRFPRGRYLSIRSIVALATIQR